MQSRGTLMIEHRLIERMLQVIKTVLVTTELNHEIDPVFVDTAVDFIRVYADRTHHGKEEDILFQKMKNKNLSDEDQRTMNELIGEHRYARQITEELVSANTRYRNGDKTALKDITEKFNTLIGFYPGHIRKEDKNFFPASRVYFTDEEDRMLLEEYWEFDRKMIHEKYGALVEDLLNLK